MAEKSQTVVLICQVMAHYRHGVYSELDKSCAFEYTFASDPDGRHYNLETVGPELVKRHVMLKNHYFGRRLSWQSGVLSLAVFGDYDMYIFTGDASIISTWLASVVVRLRHKRVAFWTIGWHRPERGLKRVVRVLFYRLANKLLIYGKIGKELGVAHGYPQERMFVIYNSVALDGTGRASGARSALRHNQTSVPIVGAVARLTVTKQFDMLLSAANVLLSRGTPVKVLLVGDGPAREDLQTLARLLNVDLDCPGPLYDSVGLAEVYDRLDLTVVPVAVGLTAIQSLAHGVPVISDDDIYRQMPEWESLREGKTGGTYTRGDILALSDCIADWLDIVATQRLEVSAACAEEVEHRWTPVSHAAAIEGAMRAGESRKGRSGKGRSPYGA